MYDVVSIGEGMLRLSPPPFERIRRAHTLDLHVCGSQGNVACNLARLGMKSAFVTKLPDNDLGLLMRDFYRDCGVATSHVRMVKEARVGLTFVEFGASPRPSAAVYDRRQSAASTLAPEDFDFDALLAGARLAYTDGILPGLSATCRETARAFLAAARRQGCLVGFDVNYREHLWSPDEAGQALGGLLGSVDLLIASPSVCESLFGIRGTAEQVLRQCHERFGCRIVACTARQSRGPGHGSFGATVLCDGKLYEGKTYEIEIVDRFGTGDAWDSGFFYGYLTRSDPQYAVDFANALCALAHTMPGDVAHATVAEVEALIESGRLELRR
jgi:2-dehydro-3-deoxygluconokinase